MGKEIDWVREEPSGRLIYRRRYPADVQAAIDKRELKVPLGAKWRMSETASETYFQACARFDRDVRTVPAAQRMRDKEQAAAFDSLTPERIDYLAGVLIHDRRTGMEKRLRQGYGRLLGAGWDLLLPKLREIRVDANAALLEETLGSTADDLLRSEGLRLAPSDNEGRLALLWALSAKLVQEGDNFIKHADGHAPPIALPPPRPESPEKGRRTVADLVATYKKVKWDGWSQSSRSAVEPAFRALNDAIGDKALSEIDRDAARGVFELVKSLPAALGRNKELKNLPVPDAVERGRALGLPTISPKTVNGSYMAHISAAFGWAEEEQWITKNPFKGLAVVDPVAERDKRDAFTIEQLEKLFSAAPWERPRPHEAEKPGRYWIPLIALFSSIVPACHLSGLSSIRSAPDTVMPSTLWLFRLLMRDLSSRKALWRSEFKQMCFYVAWRH